MVNIFFSRLEFPNSAARTFPCVVSSVGNSRDSLRWCVACWFFRRWVCVILCSNSWFPSSSFKLLCYGFVIPSYVCKFHVCERISNVPRLVIHPYTYIFFLLNIHIFSKIVFFINAHVNLHMYVCIYIDPCCSVYNWLNYDNTTSLYLNRCVKYALIWLNGINQDWIMKNMKFLECEENNS